MENCCAFIATSEQSRWELLFYSLQDTLAMQCDGAKIPAFFYAENEPKAFAAAQEQVQASEDFFQNILLLGKDAALLTVQDFADCLERHKTQENDATLFRGQPCASSLGWYTRESFLRLNEKLPQKIGIFTTENLQKIATRTELSAANEKARQREIAYHLERGVNIPFAQTVVIAPGVVIEPDATILMGSVLKGKTVVRKNAVIGQNTQLVNTTVGEYTEIIASFVSDSTIGNFAKIGPMAHIRPGCTIGDDTKVGDFVELKNATLGERNTISHLTYLGDCTVGDDCNFGCGTTTVNYDGTKKHRTTIGSRVFVGCATNLVAPITLGDGAYTAAGSTITVDVPSNALAIARTKQENKENWRKKRGLYEK